MEVGPLSRMLVAYASGHPASEDAGGRRSWPSSKLPPTALFSTLGRIAARAIEAHVMAGRVCNWVAQLDDNMGHGDCAHPQRREMGSRYLAEDAPGFRLPRGAARLPGALGCKLKNKKIKNYQAVVPTTWNAGPRDAKGQRGAYEAALLKTPIADPERPVEILRTVHSFDPCLACAVHVVDARGRRFQVKAS